VDTKEQRQSNQLNPDACDDEAAANSVRRQDNKCRQNDGPPGDQQQVARKPQTSLLRSMKYKICGALSNTITLAFKQSRPIFLTHLKT
jgi:hypothetical protein